uniref:Retrotransposon Copia-like N-terminal domain-containing protein n=1 Tax=Quercus lobata TaxID=97700 RepID=A0A7N2KVB8_QUELO
MQREIDDLKRKLHHAQQRQSRSRLDAPSDDESDDDYRRRSRTPPSSTSTTASNHDIYPSLLLLFNMMSMMIVKLDYNNYLVWRLQIEVILEAYSMINFIEDSNGAPDHFLKDSSTSAIEAEAIIIITEVVAMVEAMVTVNPMGILVLVMVVRLMDLMAMVKVHSLDLLLVQNGHTTLDCYDRMNFAYQGRHALAKLVSMATSSMATVASSNQNSFWLTDTGAFDHVTPDLVQLSLHQQPTVGNESVTVGSWQELLVTHFGNGKILYKGLSKDGVYPIPLLH